MKALRGRKIRFKGVSALGFGASWDLSNADRDAVRAFLGFMEDRRVLYVATHLEIVSDVERSVHDIRRKCTEVLALVSEKARAAQHVRAIRAACRRFLEEPHQDFRNLSGHAHGRFQNEHGFFTALGELRARLGNEIAALATYYDIELEPELASILPPEDRD